MTEINSFLKDFSVRTVLLRFLPQYETLVSILNTSHSLKKVDHSEVRQEKEKTSL